MKDAYYFSHDSNARHDPKIAALRQKYGWCGYGLYWAVVECLRDQPDYSYPNGVLYGLAIAIGYDPNDPEVDAIKFGDFIQFCISIKLFEVVDGMLLSRSLINRMKSLNEYRTRLSEAGKIGAERRWGSHKPPIIGSDATPIAVKESKVKLSKVKNKINTSLFDFESLWTTYPNRVGRKAAERSFGASVKSAEDFTAIQTALKNYLESERVAKGFVQNGSTWFANWRDWVEPPKKGNDDIPASLRHLV